MTDDIVKRLREGTFGSDETKTDCVLTAYMHQAADEIERLRALAQTAFGLLWQDRHTEARLHLSAALTQEQKGEGIAAGVLESANGDIKTLAESAFSNRQFYVSRRANTADLQAILTASRQPYSLSRFKVGDVGFGPSAGPVKVRIKAGGSTVNLKRAFYVRAPNGAVGIAVRSKQPLDNSRGARRIKGTDVYVLFGPSPDQLMRRLAPASVPDVENYLNREFSRQIVRVING